MRDYDFDDFNMPDADPEILIGGRWTAADEVPSGWHSGPDWWDSEAFGESFDDYMEHTD